MVVPAHAHSHVSSKKRISCFSCFKFSLAAAGLLLALGGLTGCDGDRPAAGADAAPALQSPTAQFFDLALPEAPWTPMVTRAWTSTTGRELDAVYSGGTDVPGMIAALVEANNQHGWVVVSKDPVVLQRGDEQLFFAAVAGAASLRVRLEARP